jgi:hypothetical protein
MTQYELMMLELITIQILNGIEEDNQIKEIL